MTDPKFHHSVSLAPGGKHCNDIAQTPNTPPVTNVVDAKKKLVAELAKIDLTKYDELGLKKVEAFTFTSADGVTELHGSKW